MREMHEGGVSGEDVVGHTEPALGPDLLASMREAIRQELAASRPETESLSLEIDGIEHLQSSGGRFVYRLLLSHPVHFAAEQAISFRTRADESIAATVVKSGDEGLVVATEQPLPVDARLIRATFDPGFIYRALGEYLEQAHATPVSELLLNGSLPSIPDVRSWAYGDFNEEQAAAIKQMDATPLHLLWGPPGTGKTTTLGEAAAGWLRQKRRVLIVSTSNAAVDVAMKALLKQIKFREREHVVRLGTSLDQAVLEITPAGKLQKVNWQLGAKAREAQQRLNQITELLAHHTNCNERYHELLAEYRELEGIVRQFNEDVDELAPKVLAEALVTGCTLAKMVLDKGLRQTKFDIVVLDETSMASLVYAVAASTLAKHHLVFAGDPKQLPPICQSNEDEAQEWFGQNVYDWFGVGDEEGDTEQDAPQFSRLRTQYRMTDEIGGLVSRLSYGNILRHGRQEQGAPIEFIDVPAEWDSTHYSVAEKSYFHLGSVPIIHKLARFLARHDELLMLSPFRPQRSLLSALAFDLAPALPRTKIAASTIHRAQGSESRAVILDLTTHDPRQLVAFFRDRHCNRLFNVGISRARDHLVIIGSRRMVTRLASENAFWRALLKELDARGALPAEEILGDPLSVDRVASLVTTPSEDKSPALYAHSSASGDLHYFIDLLKNATATRKMLVLSNDSQTSGPFIVRHAPDRPAVFAGNGHLCVPFRGGWFVTRAPNVSRVVWRIGFSHLAKDEVRPHEAKRFFCSECFNGNLVLRRAGGEGWFLVCTNAQAFECSYRRRLSLEDAELKVRLTGMTCRDGHPFTARSSSRGIFIGCENYPVCQHTESLSLLNGL